MVENAGPEAALVRLEAALERIASALQRHAAPGHEGGDGHPGDGAPGGTEGRERMKEAAERLDLLIAELRGALDGRD